MTKKISGAEFPLAKVFSSDFDYVIPSYRTVAAKRAVHKGQEHSHD
jgi:hypothetical protein